MALAFVVTLEKELPAAAAAVRKGAERQGARPRGRPDRLRRPPQERRAADRRCCRESQAALIEQLKADGFDPSKMRLPPEQWFPAAEGLEDRPGAASSTCRRT